MLGRCAYVEVATRDPTLVCQLHLGLVEGIAMALEESAVVELAALEDPRRAECRVQLRISAGAAQTLPQSSRDRVDRLSEGQP